MRKILSLCVLMLAGCASNVMKGYMGKPLQEAMIDYGSPTNAFDMPDGSRAFQWVMTSTYVTPTRIANSGAVYPNGYNATWGQQTTITGGQPVTNECAYTMFAKWDDLTSTWVFTGFRKPKVMCE